MGIDGSLFYLLLDMFISISHTSVWGLSKVKSFADDHKATKAWRGIQKQPVTWKTLGSEGAAPGPPGLDSIGQGRAPVSKSLSEANRPSALTQEGNFRSSLELEMTLGAHWGAMYCFPVHFSFRRAEAAHKW